jgi:cytochrome c-type biogenesis protein CcmH
MKILRFLPGLVVVCLLSVGLSSHVQAQVTYQQFESSEQYQQYRQLAEQLRCVVCANQSILESNAPVAESMRQEVFDLMVNKEMAPQAILASMKQSYGQSVHYRPPMTAETRLLWWGPWAILVLAFVGGFFWVRRLLKS